PDRFLAERPSAPVVVVERLAHGEVTGRTDVTAPETASEEPVSGPSAEPAEIGEPRDDMLGGRETDGLELDRAGDGGAGQDADGRGLARGVLQRPELLWSRPREPRRLGKGPHGLAPHPHGRSVSAHQARAAREGEREVDLLGRYRPDQHFEGRGRQSRPETVERLDERRERKVALRHAVEARQVEVEPEDAPYLGDRGRADRVATGARNPDDDARVVDGAGPPNFVGHQPVL